MRFKNTLDLRRWREVLDDSDLATSKAKAYGRARESEAGSRKEEKARAEFIESCGGPQNARIFAGYNSDDDWREFREQEPEFTKIIDDIRGVFHFYWKCLDSDPNAFNNLAGMEAAVEALRKILSEGAIHPKKISYRGREGWRPLLHPSRPVQIFR